MPSSHVSISPRALLTAALLLATAAVLAGAERPAAAQQLEPVETPFAPPPPIVSVLRSLRPTVMVAFRGEYGPIRASGTLTQAPDAGLVVLDARGQERQIAWSELRELSVVRTPREGMRVGSFSISLASDEGALPRTTRALSLDPGAGGGGGAYAAGAAISRFARPWRAQELPPGEVVLEGQPYGRMAIPIQQVEEWTAQPLRGSVTTMPEGQIQIEVANRVMVSVPLPSLETMRRDPMREFISVTLSDGQMFSGMLRALPDVQLPIAVTAAETVQVPLAEVVQLDISRVPLGLGGELPLLE